MHSKKQRIAAWVGIILLIALYLFTLLAAIFNFDGKGLLFRTSLIATIAIPILLWVYIWMIGMISKKHTIASVDYDFTAGIETENIESDSNNKTSQL